MVFYIYIRNHGPAIQDTALLLQKSLESCGHLAYLSNKLAANACNIVIDNFGPVLVEWLVKLASGGTPLIVWGSEEVTGETFNANVEGYYGSQDHWKARFLNFCTVAEHAKAIWVPAESLVAPYQAIVPGIPVQFLPHGYAEGFPVVTHRPEAAKNIDFYFTGRLTPHRQQLLDALAKRHSVMSHFDEVPEYLRREYLSRAKVCLSLRVGPDTRLPSVSRIHSLVMNRCFTVHEQCQTPSHLDRYVVHTPTAQLPEACAAALAAPDRPAQAQATLERLRAELPMREIVPRLLDELFVKR